MTEVITVDISHENKPNDIGIRNNEAGPMDDDDDCFVYESVPERYHSQPGMFVVPATTHHHNGTQQADLSLRDGLATEHSIQTPSGQNHPPPPPPLPSQQSASRSIGHQSITSLQSANGRSRLDDDR